jgi:hypothetical protein
VDKFFLGNLLRFGRFLRLLGFHISSDQIYDLADGLAYIDLVRREDFYYAARSFFVHDVAQIDLFERAFSLFWAGNLEFLVEFGAASRVIPRRTLEDDLSESDEPVLRSGSGLDISQPPELPQPEADLDKSLKTTYSPDEVLRHKDISQFSEPELEQAKRIIHNLVWRISEHPTRRKVRALKRDSYLDLRRTVRNSLDLGGEIVSLEWQQRKEKPRPLVVICDISGSMERYSRLFLHFLYALAQESQRVEVFVFGTRLTRLTPELRRKDVDQAVRRTSQAVLDWSGGTRIGESLRTFNYQWARRVLGRGAVLLMISDGWDRGDTTLLDKELARLRRSVSRLIWLNPLLGLPDYQPLVRGIQVALPYIDEFLPLHNLDSFERLKETI